MDKSESCDYIVNHVKSHNISYMTKSEWEQLFIFTWIKSTYKRDLSSLTVDNLYEIAETFNIDFNQMSNIIKKCKRLEPIDKPIKINKDNCIKLFEDLINSNAIFNFSLSENLSVKFKILNPIMLSELQKILNILGIFSDTSISKDIVTITTDSFLELTGTKKNLPTVIKSVLSGIIENVKDYIGKNDNNDSTIEELKKEIDKAKTNETISGLVSDLKNISNFKIDLYKITNEILNNILKSKECLSKIIFGKN